MAVIKNNRLSTPLQALTLAALALPGLAQAAEEETGFQYGRYQEGERQLYGVQSRFKPITVDSLQNRTTLKLTDRIRLAFSYAQDTWGGATPVTTAPLAFAGNREGGIISGATPFLQNTTVYFDKRLRPLLQNSDTGAFSRNSQLVHTLSSASPETRRQGDFLLGYDWNEAALDVAGGLSVEPDYESRYGSINSRLDFNQKQTTLNLVSSYTVSDTNARLDHDAAPYIETATFTNQVSVSSDGTKNVRGRKQDWSTSLSLTQVLNKSALLQAGVSYTRSTGYMNNPYKVVTVAFVDPTQTAIDGRYLVGESRAFLEQRPQERNQWALNLGYSQHISTFDAALQLNYRFFHDDWNINAHTFSADWRQPLGHGWMVTPRIRYYSQDAADFYAPYLISHQAANKISTDANGNLVVTPYNPGLLPSTYSSDHRLSGYGALSGGLTINKQFAKGVNLEASAEYYSHAGSLKLGGGGEGRYADFDYYLVNAALKIDLSALALASVSSGQHVHHHHHHHHSAPAGVMFDHMLKTDEFMVGYRYQYGSQAGNMLSGANAVNESTLVNNACGNGRCYVTPDNMTMHMHMLDFMYAPTDWLTLMLMPQFMDMHMTMRPLTGAPEVSFSDDPAIYAAVNHADHPHTTSGIGDTGFYALFKAYDDNRHHIHVTLGLSAPTGDSAIKLRDSHRQKLGFIHYGMQLGSGTWDFKPNLTYTGQWQDWSWGAQLNGTVRMEDHNASGFAYGDMFQTTAWGSYNLLNWLSASVRGIYSVQGSLRKRYNDTYHLIGPMDYAGSYGGRYWDIGLGLQAAIPSGSLQGNRIGFEWLQPVSDDVNGYQLERNGALSATWSYAF